MQILIADKGIIDYKETQYNLGIYQPIDDNSIHVQLYNEFNDNLFCFLLDDTIINGEICTTMTEFINQLNS